METIVKTLAEKIGLMEALVDLQLHIEEGLTALKIRNTHLGKNKTPDPETKALQKRWEQIKEDEFVRPVAEILQQHPAYPWFSRVKGIGQENIAKVVSFIDIERAPAISSLWKYAGYAVDEDGVADRPEKGKKLHFNKTLKVMCWRVGTSLIKAHQVAEEGTCFGRFFDKALKEEVAKFQAKGKQVIPTEEWKKFPAKVERETKKLAALKKSEETMKPELYAKKIAAMEKSVKEAKEMLEKHVSNFYAHNRALRRMIKLFLGCLWLYWRKAESLPIRDPYSVEKLGHTTVIQPEEMVDR